MLQLKWKEQNGEKKTLGTIITKGHYAYYIKEVYKSVWKVLQLTEMASQEHIKMHILSGNQKT